MVEYNPFGCRELTCWESANAVRVSSGSSLPLGSHSSWLEYTAHSLEHVHMRQ